MKPTDRQAYVERYERRLAEFGHSPETLGWGKPGREHLRFAVVAGVVAEVGADSVLDVGCGFADLFDHLSAEGWAGRYVGIDIVPGLLERARQRHPSLELIEADLDEVLPGQHEVFDVVAASGVFNAALDGEDNAVHVERSLRRMFDLCRSVVCVDFMSTLVDFRHDGAWHADPVWVAATAGRLSRRFRLRHDYLPFEFAVVIFRNAAQHGSVFTSPLGSPAGIEAPPPT